MNPGEFVMAGRGVKVGQGGVEVRAVLESSEGELDVLLVSQLRYRQLVALGQSHPRRDADSHRHCCFSLIS